MTIRILLFASLLVMLAPAVASADAPPGATARCVDGTYSFSATRSGTCSHHGGVAVWLTPTPAPAPTPTTAPTPAPAPAPAPTPGPTPTQPPSAVPVVLGLRTRTAGCRTGVLPDRACSPGAADPRVTQSNIQSTICVSGYTATVRNVPTSEKNAVYSEYGIVHHAPYSYEVDHIVSLELGGSNTIANLFPEAYAGQNGARVKDVLENRLHRQVCSGQLTLRQAQTAIAVDWLAASARYDAK
jgi:hypothetical protein